MKYANLVGANDSIRGIDELLKVLLAVFEDERQLVDVVDDFKKAKETESSASIEQRDEINREN